MADSYESYRVKQVIAGLQGVYERPTHAHVIHTLEAIKLPTVASWYWQNLGLSEEDLDLPLA